MRKIDRDFGPQQQAASREEARRAPIQGVIEPPVGTVEAASRQRLRQRADAAAASCLSFADYQQRLEAAGVELVPVVQLAGTRLCGLSYRLDGVTIKGSELGKAYGPAGL